MITIEGEAMNREARTRAAIRKGLAASVLVAAAAGLLAQGPSEDGAEACATKYQQDAVTVKGLVFKDYRDGDWACLQVIREGKVIFRRTEEFPEAYTIGQKADPQHGIPAIANGTDVTGRGRADMVVSSYSGGAHCCMSHYVFELEPEFKLLTTLNDADDDLAHFQRAADGRYDYITADWTFAYWPSCFLCSPSALVTLRWVNDAKGGGFHLATGRMQTPAPTAAEWNKELSAAQTVVAAGDAESIGTTMWQTVLDLIYTGHSDLAWKFVDALGPKAQQKPLPSLGDFCSLLKASPYWADLQPTLKDVPPKCANAKAAQSN
ncbi:MAG: hypothetical protein ABSF23_17605 [Terracidiphilus sp.]